jgi:hypothetical protein
MGVLRVAAYLSVLLTILALAVGRRAYARATDVAWAASRELDGLADVVGMPKTLFVNGAAMHVATAMTEQSPKEVLDRFEALCREHPQFLARAMDDVPEEMRHKAEAAMPGMSWRRLTGLGIVRREDPDRGMLVCFTDDRPAHVADLKGRVQALKESGDLSELGRFHYVMVKRTPAGTNVRTVWNEGSLPVARMFPAKGDALGTDSPDVPRPPNSRRTLSASAAEVPFSVHVYESTDNLAAMRAFYDREMAARGWQLHDAGSTVTYEKPGADFVYCSFSARDGRSTVIATATGRAGLPKVAGLRVEP